MKDSLSCKKWGFRFFALGLWVMLGLFLFFILGESISTWERNQLFRFSVAYISFFSPNGYPLLLYIQAFFTQFYILPLLGSFIISGICVLNLILLKKITGSLAASLLFLALILPSIAFFNVLWVLVWLFVFLQAFIVLKFAEKKWGWLIAFVSTFLLSFLLQENIVIAILFSTLCLVCSLYSKKADNKIKKLILLSLGIIIGGALGISTIYIVGEPFFYPSFFKEFRLLSFNTFNVLEYPSMFFIYPSFLKIISICSFGVILLPLIMFLKKNSAWEYVFSILLIPSLFICHSFNNEAFYKTERLAIEGRWQKALDVCNKGHRESKHYDSFKEWWMSDNIKICLLANKQLTGKIFEYNGNINFPYLFTGPVMYSPSSFLLSLYYALSGMYAESLHINYDFITTHRITAAVLENIIKSSIIVKDYAPCYKFTAILKESLFYRKKGIEYENLLKKPSSIDHVPEFAAARLSLSKTDHTVLAYHPDDNMKFRIIHEKDNVYVYEYCLSLWLIYKNHYKILEELPTIQKFYPKLPLHIQEAILACFPPERAHEFVALVSPAVINNYIGFCQANSMYQGGFIAFKKLRKNFEKTYWFHLFYNTTQTIGNKQTQNNTVN